MSLNSLLVHTFDIQIETVTVGDGGGKARTYATSKAGIQGRIEELSTRQQEFLYQQKHIEATHRLFFDSDPGITKSNMSQHQIVGVTPAVLLNRTFAVHGVKNEQELSRLWELLLLESEFRENQ